MATEHPEAYDYYKGLVLAIIFADDQQLPPPPRPASFTVDKFLNTMPQADITRIVVDPKALGWSPVGHVNAFRASHKSDVWPALAKWIKHGEICPSLQGGEWNPSLFKPSGDGLSISAKM